MDAPPYSTNSFVLCGIIIISPVLCWNKHMGVTNSGFVLYAGGKSFSPRGVPGNNWPTGFLSPYVTAEYDFIDVKIHLLAYLKAKGLTWKPLKARSSEWQWLLLLRSNVGRCARGNERGLRSLQSTARLCSVPRSALPVSLPPRLLLIRAQHLRLTCVFVALREVGSTCENTFSLPICQQRKMHPALCHHVSIAFAVMLSQYCSFSFFT